MHHTDAPRSADRDEQDPDDHVNAAAPRGSVAAMRGRPPRARRSTPDGSRSPRRRHPTGATRCAAVLRSNDDASGRRLPPIGHDSAARWPRSYASARSTPAKGEPFREFRVAAARGEALGPRAPGDDAALPRRRRRDGHAVAVHAGGRRRRERRRRSRTRSSIALWELNPLLGKTVLDLVAQRAYGKDEIYKHLGVGRVRGHRAVAARARDLAPDRDRDAACCARSASPSPPGPRTERYVAARGRDRRRRVPRRGQARCPSR